MSESCKLCGAEMKIRDKTIRELLDGFLVKQYFCSVCGKAGRSVVEMKQ